MQAEEHRVFEVVRMAPDDTSTFTSMHAVLLSLLAVAYCSEKIKGWMNRLRALFQI